MELIEFKEIIENAVEKDEKIENIKIDFEEELSNDEFINIDFLKVEFRGINIIDSIFEKVSFVNCEFENCNFSNTTFENVYYILSYIGFSYEQLKQISLNTIDAAFLSEKEKEELKSYLK